MEFDHTERIFRHPYPIFDSNPRFLVQPTRRTNENFQYGTLLWISPNGNVVSGMRNFKIDMKQRIFIIELSNAPLNSGLWTAIYIDFEKKAHYFEFLMVSDFTNKPENALPLMNHESPLVEKIMNSKSDLEDWIEINFQFKEKCFVGKTCETSNWSSKSKDAKVEL